MVYRTPERLPYFPALVELQEELARQLTDIDGDSRRMFPISCCNEATRAVQLVTGLEEIGGRYKPRREKHAWNYDPVRKLYVDLTLGQFSPSRKLGGIPDIAVLVASDEILIRDDALTQKQRAMQFEEVSGIVEPLLASSRRQ
jgi:hypothetical protein